mmetsp:Transcript_86028/g.216558  ORF Transcript_86028/g.216558 Transcript_86028/m.216558 type:complete len:243 (+) Transcript_86028:239-967(+)
MKPWANGDMAPNYSSVCVEAKAHTWCCRTRPDAAPAPPQELNSLWHAVGVKATMRRSQRAPRPPRRLPRAAPSSSPAHAVQPRGLPLPASSARQRPPSTTPHHPRGRAWFLRGGKRHNPDPPPATMLRPRQRSPRRARNASRHWSRARSHKARPWHGARTLPTAPARRHAPPATPGPAGRHQHRRGCRHRCIRRRSRGQRRPRQWTTAPKVLRRSLSISWRKHHTQTPSRCNGATGRWWRRI